MNGSRLRFRRIYFIQEGETGPVKIGLSVDPIKRLTSLQVGRRGRVRLLGVTGGPVTYADEAAIHSELAAHLVEGREWFAPHPDVFKVAARECGAFMAPEAAL